MEYNRQMQILRLSDEWGYRLKDVQPDVNPPLCAWGSESSSPTFFISPGATEGKISAWVLCILWKAARVQDLACLRLGCGSSEASFILRQARGPHHSPAQLPGGTAPRASALCELHACRSTKVTWARAGQVHGTRHHGQGHPEEPGTVPQSCGD